MTTPRKTRVQDALDHLTITTDQQRKAGIGGQVGGSVGALTGTAAGAGIGAASAVLSRGRLNRAIAGATKKKKARLLRELEGLKKPGERATTGAFLGAGSGTAVGGGLGAAAGLYSGRRKPRDGDGDGILNEGKVKKGFEDERSPYDQRVGESNRQMAARFDRSSRAGDAAERPYRRTSAGAVLGGAATAAALHRRKPKAALAAGVAGLVAGGAVSGTGSARRRKTFTAEMSKAQGRDEAGRFADVAAGTAGVAAAGGAVDSGRKARGAAHNARTAASESAFWRESAGEFGRDAAQASKLARANTSFAESAGSAADTAPRRGHYMAQSRAWSQRTKTFAGHAQREGQRAQNLLAAAKTQGGLARRHTVLSAGLGTTAAVAGGAVAARNRTVEKSFDETRHARGRDGKFAKGTGGVTEAPGSRKPLMDPDTERKVATGLIGLSTVANAAALKSSYKETKSAPAYQAALAEAQKKAAKTHRTLSRGRRAGVMARHAGAKVALPLAVADTAAGLLAGKVMNSKKKDDVTKVAPGTVARASTSLHNVLLPATGIAVASTLVGPNKHKNKAKLRRVMKSETRESPVAKSAEQIMKDAREFRYDKKTGQRRNNAYTNPTTGQSMAQALTTTAGTYAGAAVGAKGVMEAPKLTGKVNAEATRRVLSGRMGVKNGMKAVKIANQVGAAAKHPNALGAGLIVGGIAGAAAAHRATATAQNRGTTTKSRQQHRARDGKFTKRETPMTAAPNVERFFEVARIEKFERETKRAAKKGATAGAAIGGSLGAARGLAGGVAIAGAKGAVPGAIGGGIRGGVRWGALGGAGGAAVGASQAHDRIKAKKKKVAKSAPSVDDVFAIARGIAKSAPGQPRKQYEASTGAQIGGAVAGGVGATVGGNVLATKGVRAAQAASRGTAARSGAVKVARMGQRLRSNKGVALAAGAGALAGTAATFKEKKQVQKSFDTADELFESVEKNALKILGGAAKNFGYAGAVGGARLGMAAAPKVKALAKKPKVRLGAAAGAGALAGSTFSKPKKPALP